MWVVNVRAVLLLQGKAAEHMARSSSNYLKEVPMRRVAQAEDVAEAVLFLTPPQASYLTGQMIDVDGGWTTTKPSIVGLATALPER